MSYRFRYKLFTPVGVHGEHVFLRENPRGPRLVVTEVGRRGTIFVEAGNVAGIWIISGV
jgi:hypothetical protein